MSIDDLDFWSWLMLPSSKLVELGAPRKSVVDLRFAATGHLRAAPIAWASALFSWGSVNTANEIAEMTRHELAQVREYAKGAGLRYATRHRRRTHAELAIALWCDRHRAPVESCAHFGVPPGARRILCAAMQVIIETADGGVKEVLGWRRDKLEQQFAELRLDLLPPPSALAAARSAGEQRGPATSRG